MIVCECTQLILLLYNLVDDLDDDSSDDKCRIQNQKVGDGINSSVDTHETNYVSYV